MARSLEIGEPEQISFELECFELTAEHRLELSGRWFGVRGRIFVRPTLILLGDVEGERSRCLADLEHKPWGAEDGEPWQAAFPLDPETGAVVRPSSRWRRTSRSNWRLRPRFAIARPSAGLERTRCRQRRAMTWVSRLAAVIVLLAAIAVVLAIVPSSG